MRIIWCGLSHFSRNISAPAQCWLTPTATNPALSSSSSAAVLWHGNSPLLNSIKRLNVKLSENFSRNGHILHGLVIVYCMRAVHRDYRLPTTYYLVHSGNFPDF